MSKPEELLAFQLKAARISFRREVKCIPHRSFRFDFECGAVHLTPEIITPTPRPPVLVEVQGGVWRKGAHSSGVGVTRDCEKAALAAVQGYRLIPVTPAHIKSGQALKWIEQALGI